MSKDDEHRVAGRLQKLVDEEWPEPRAIALDGPGPFELPLSGHASILEQGPHHPFLLILETTKKSQRVRIPIPLSELQSLKPTAH